MAQHMHARRAIVPLLCVVALLALAMPNPAAGAYAIRIIFLHHSVGQGLIEQGQVREGLSARGYEFFDHGYNDEGLRLDDGSYSGTNFDVPDDNTDPDGLAAIFAQPMHDPPDNTFSYLLQYDVIAFKSCYPTSNIGSDEQLADYHSYYLAIRGRIDQFPDKLFVLFTPPPQVPALSDPEEGARARAFARWLQSDDYLGGRSNMVVFDFFGYLAGEDNFLRPEYRADEQDGHPNELANQAVGPIFVDFLDQVIRNRGAVLPAAPEEDEVAVPEPAPAEGSLAVAKLLDGFEGGSNAWHSQPDDLGSTIACAPTSDLVHSGGAALQIGFELVQDGWVSCGRSFDVPQDWAGADGLSLWLRADQPAQPVTLELFAGDLEAPTPFQIDFQTPGQSTEEWAQFLFRWTDFARADWADPGGLNELDPAHITGYSFSLSAGPGPAAGNIRIDDLDLAVAEPVPTEEATTPPLGQEQPPQGEEQLPQGEEQLSQAEEQPVQGEEQPPVAQVNGDEDAAQGNPLQGVCPLATTALPLLALASLVMARRRRL